MVKSRSIHFMRKKLINFLLILVPDYILGRIIYRYQAFVNKLISILNGLSFFPLFKISSLRNVEYKFVIDTLKQLRNEGRRRILDVGCSGSFLCYELLSLGLEVHGLDIEPYPIKKTSFKLHLCDITKTSFSDNYFDYVVMVSALEHVGLGAYGDPIHPNGDLIAIKEIHRILSPNGYLLITVPYSSKYKITWQRIYDWKRLMSIIDKLFAVLKTDFYIPARNFYSLQKDLFFGGGKWTSVTREEAKRISRSTACLLLQKI